MIALRGTLSRSEGEDGRSNNGQWQWKGMWAFGTGMPPDLNMAKPFQYTWVEQRKASDVEIPSLEENDTVPFNQNEKNSEDLVQDNNNSNSEMKDQPESNKTETKDEKQQKQINEIGEQKSTNQASLDHNKQSTQQQDTPNTQKQTRITADTPQTTKTTNDIAKPKPKQESDTTNKPPQLNNTHIPPNPPPINQTTTNQNTQLMLKSQKDQPMHIEQPTTKSNQKTITFATTPDDQPDFTEASTKFPQKVPFDGRWDGYFENAPKRKNAANSKVKESFHLFLNATPGDHAQALFLDINGNEATSLTQLKQGIIHARGTGSNQFGTFELTGSLDLKTNVLECQRMYIITADQKVSPNRRSSQHRKRDSTRSYSTRKRQLSWQRKSSLSDNEDEIGGLRRTNMPKPKRPKAPGRPSVETGTPFIPSKRPTHTTPGNTATAAVAAIAAAIAAGPKKRSGRTSASVTPSNNSTSNNLQQLKLPSVGDPMEARWRSPHYLYYERYDTSNTEENGNNNNGNTATSFVIYEGELLNGNCERDGRGVCLYNNGTLYEGEWKHNREHGKGTLMTADRSRIIYKGEWERGRMHGQGLYNYQQDESTLFSSNSVQEARYEGDFKENARHGNGKYYLPDGSTYEGEWRENYMNGRGTFVWPDNSVYIGTWKDGERHGQGLLRTSDGFTYDGTWVQNAMEGRGYAMYPNGQRYEGLWANGRREGRGTIHFKDFAIYEGRFRDDCVEGQGTMKMTRNVTVPSTASAHQEEGEEASKEDNWMIPISFQSNMGHIHQKAGFTVGGE